MPIHQKSYKFKIMQTSLHDSSKDEDTSNCWVWSIQPLVHNKKIVSKGSHPPNEGVVDPSFSWIE